LTHAKAPELAIIDDNLWQSVQRRLAANAAPAVASVQPRMPAFWTRKRPKHLVTEKAFCGLCNRGMGVTGQDYLKCSGAKEGACSNHHTIRRGRVEALLMDMLARSLMQSEMVERFIAAFNEEWRQLVAAYGGKSETQKRKLAGLRVKIANITKVVSDGSSSRSLLAELDRLEAEEAALEAKMVEPVALPPALHPGIAGVYRRHVNDLQAAMAEGDRTSSLEAARKQSTI
jgi:hypothetical protein